jgi:signal transduction histidine kinase
MQMSFGWMFSAIQLSAASMPVGQGAGLGLSISKGILDQHQAIIKVDRSFPTTCFQIGFPTAIA